MFTQGQRIKFVSESGQVLSGHVQDANEQAISVYTDIGISLIVTEDQVINKPEPLEEEQIKAITQIAMPVYRHVMKPKTRLRIGTQCLYLDKVPGISWLDGSSYYELCRLYITGQITDADSGGSLFFDDQSIRVSDKHVIFDWPTDMNKNYCICHIMIKSCLVDVANQVMTIDLDQTEYEWLHQQHKLRAPNVVLNGWTLRFLFS